MTPEARCSCAGAPALVVADPDRLDQRRQQPIDQHGARQLERRLLELPAQRRFVETGDRAQASIEPGVVVLDASGGGGCAARRYVPRVRLEQLAQSSVQASDIADAMSGVGGEAQEPYSLDIGVGVQAMAALGTGWMDGVVAALPGADGVLAHAAAAGCHRDRTANRLGKGLPHRPERTRYVHVSYRI